MVYDSDGDQVQCEGRTVFFQYTSCKARQTGGQQYHDRDSAACGDMVVTTQWGSVWSQQVLRPRDRPVTPPQYIQPPTSQFLSTFQN